MKYGRYNSVYEAEDLSILEFMSKGRNGIVRKRIIFAKTETKGIYNLAFGNIGANNNFDDGIISNNGDRNEILATIAMAVDKYTRLYRMAIGINLRELSKKFEIFAEVDGEDEIGNGQ